MGYEKFLVNNRQIQDVVLEVDEEKIPLKVKSIPWSRRNQIRSLSLMWDDKGQTKFDGDYYLRECLKMMIVEAPWGMTNDVFLSQIDESLGKALEKLVPGAFTDSNTVSPENVKKE